MPGMSRALAQDVRLRGPGFNSCRRHVIFVADGLPLKQVLLRVGLTVPNITPPLLQTQLHNSPDQAAHYHNLSRSWDFISAQHLAGYGQDGNGKFVPVLN
jgi:hypothetical protein